MGPNRSALRTEAANFAAVFDRERSVGDAPFEERILRLIQYCEERFDDVELRPLRHGLCLLVPIDVPVVH